MRGLYLISILIVLQSCYREKIIYNADSNHELLLPTILRINDKECVYDYTANSLRFPINNDIINDFSPLIEFQEYSTVYFEGEELINNSINNFGNIEINKEYDVKVFTNGETEDLLLTFTNLPIVQIITPNIIFDEPKTLAKIIVNYKEINKIADTYFIGIEYRGQTSQYYQKKSFGFSLKGSISFEDDVSHSLFDMQKNKDWILDAMWIDKARLRNKTSFELWNKFDGINHHGIDSEFVELYINNEHQGLYCLNEKINPELLNLNNPNSVLYKAIAWEDGATRFETYSDNSPINYYWDGWRQIYPDPAIEINWSPLNQLRHLVVDGNNEIFTEQIESLIDLNNFIDYYIFVNLVSATDNTGKNTFLVKENINDKLFVIPWDLEGSWGLFWDGTHLSYTSILSNTLYDRLLETNTGDFKNRLKQRWSTLRENVLSDTALNQMYLDQFMLINTSEIIDIENRKWGSNIDLNSEKQYLIDWLENRVIFLDNYFDNL